MCRLAAYDAPELATQSQNANTDGSDGDFEDSRDFGCCVAGGQQGHELTLDSVDGVIDSVETTPVIDNGGDVEDRFRIAMKPKDSCAVSLAPVR